MPDNRTDPHFDTHGEDAWIAEIARQGHAPQDLMLSRPAESAEYSTPLSPVCARWQAQMPELAADGQDDAACAEHRTTCQDCAATWDLWQAIAGSAPTAFAAPPAPSEAVLWDRVASLIRSPAQTTARRSSILSSSAHLVQGIRLARDHIKAQIRLIWQEVTIWSSLAIIAVLIYLRFSPMPWTARLESLTLLAMPLCMVALIRVCASERYLVSPEILSAAPEPAWLTMAIRVVLVSATQIGVLSLIILVTGLATGTLTAHLFLAFWLGPVVGAVLFALSAVLLLGQIVGAIIALALWLLRLLASTPHAPLILQNYEHFWLSGWTLVLVAIGCVALSSALTYRHERFA